MGKPNKKDKYFDCKNYKDHPDYGDLFHTKFGCWMVHRAIPQWENNVMALVYVGAAILVIVVGLRGLGPIVGRTFFKFLTDSSGSIATTIVITALLIEFIMICTLAVFMFFKPETADQAKRKVRSYEPEDILPNLEKVKLHIERYVENNKGVLLHDEHKNFQLAIDKVDFFIDAEKKRRSYSEEETD